MKALKTDRIARKGVSLVALKFESLGFAFREQATSDYGIDGHAELITADEPTGQLLGVQIKTGSSYFSERNENIVTFRIDKEHVDYWVNHTLPVIVCLCDLDNQEVYWHAITEENVASTGQGFRCDVPLSQKLDEFSVPSLTNFLTPVVSHDRYTIFRTDDVSHGLAKRYSFKVVINGTASVAEVASIVRQVTAEGANRQYHRNHIVEGKWGDIEAQVIWSFIYPSAEDKARYNHICRSLWINNALDEAARPVSIRGENIGDGIIVDWNKSYSYFAKQAAENTLTKEDYLNITGPLIKKLTLVLEDFGAKLLLLDDSKITEDEFLTSTDDLRKQIRSIYIDSTDMSLTPFECQEADERFRCFISSINDLSIFYSERELEKWPAHTRIWLSLEARERALKDYRELEYELKKVR